MCLCGIGHNSKDANHPQRHNIVGSNRRDAPCVHWPTLRDKKRLLTSSHSFCLLCILLFLLLDASNTTGQKVLKAAHH